MPDEAIRQIVYGQQSAEPCHNQEIATAIELLDDANRQISACESARARNWQTGDLVIVRNIYARFQTMIEDFEADPPQYQPNADKVEMGIPAPPICQQPENFGALIICRHLAGLRTQLRNGASSEQRTGFHDMELEYTIKPGLTKLDKYIQREETRLAEGPQDYFPDVRDQEADEQTPGHPDNQ